MRRPGVRKKLGQFSLLPLSNLYLTFEGCTVCRNAPLKDLKYSRLYVRSVYCTCSWKIFSDLNQNGCEIVRATVTPDFSCVDWRWRRRQSRLDCVGPAALFDLCLSAAGASDESMTM